MGVAGSGKTTIGQKLSVAARIPFFDADDFHPPANKEKMKAGQPLNDEDRKGWLTSINELAKEQSVKNSERGQTCRYYDWSPCATRCALSIYTSIQTMELNRYGRRCAAAFVLIGFGVAPDRYPLLCVEGIQG